ncbi:MAG: cbb3-type cytochrome oxidase assembly protein CcoS [Cyclobacteriaceae bacterium]
MNVILILILFSLLVAGIFLIAFFWAVKSGQFDDTYSPSVRILFDDELKKDESEKKNQSKKSRD